MTGDVENLTDARDAGPPAVTNGSIPLTVRLAHEIPKPRDWQAFQRSCVLLFCEELQDPTAQEYGRNGQNQRGIDILGRRHPHHDHYVGVQCRLIVAPLKRAKILSDCREALGLKASLKEIIFATTAPDSTDATDAAIEVERILRADGHDLKVVVYGWGALQTLIAKHEVAYHAFFPAAVRTSAPQLLETTSPEFVTRFADQVAAQLRNCGVTSPPPETISAGLADEDPALHARIDIYRDLFKNQNQPQLAERELLSLLENESLDNKPWARYRIETNLGAIAAYLGRESEGATRFEAAYAVRPHDSNAIANLALARMIRGQFEEAMGLARHALDGIPRADHAVGYLLQAAARTTWQGDPEELIPPDLVGTVHADLGLAEFLRHRKHSDWAQRCIELSRRHPESPDFKRINAAAVLVLAVESDATILGGLGPITYEELNHAADDMKAIAENCLEIGFADRHDLVAYLNNAAMLLRLCERHVESEALLRRGLLKAPGEVQLSRLLALAQATLDRREDALATLAGDCDPENQLLCAEFIAADDPIIALAKVLAIDPAALDTRLSELRWRLVGELALRTRNSATLESAIAGLRILDPANTAADLLEIRAARNSGCDDEEVQTRLRELATTLPPDSDMAIRYALADELNDHELPEVASHLLEKYIDLSRRSSATMLYLRSLARARRDDAFHRAVASISPEVRNHPDTLWTIAAHAWNVGDLPRAYDAIEALLVQKPDNPRARLLKIEVLIRQNRSVELLAELDQPIETLNWTRLQDQFRIAALLNYFGHVERATALAYRLFIEHRDESRAWMTLSMLVLEEGRGKGTQPGLLDAREVASNIAVDLRYDDGDTLFFVIEPDEQLRKFDDEAWEPEHALVRGMWGLMLGDRFVDPNGREGAITQLRHKYVARLHYVLENHETRFPEIHGFSRVTFDIEQPNGLDPLIAKLRARQEWIKQEEEQYRNGRLPIGVLAHRLGLDVIEVSAGLASHGGSLKVAVGNQSERNAAIEEIRQNDRKGCVLDVLTYWTAWRLEGLEAIIATCGPIHLTQGVMDRLRARREQIEHAVSDGFRSLGYEHGKLAIREVESEVVAEWRDDIDRAIAWAKTHAIIRPLVAGDDLPEALRDLLRTERSDIFDGIILATQDSLLLVTDDLPTREVSRSVGGGGGAWLHQIFGVALQQRSIDFETYIRWCAHLIGAGQDYLGVSAPVLAQAARMDAEAGEAPGYLFQTLSKVIGGQGAEPISHTFVCLECLHNIWIDPSTVRYRAPATSFLLRQLLRERRNDYGIILRTLLKFLSDTPGLGDHIEAWARGHFLAEYIHP